MFGPKHATRDNGFHRRLSAHRAHSHEIKFNQEETTMSHSTRNNHRTAVPPSQELVLLTAGLALFVGAVTRANAADAQMDYRVLATSRTSTMEKELNDAALSGYRFSKVMGGKTANGWPSFTRRLPSTVAGGRFQAFVRAGQDRRVRARTAVVYWTDQSGAGTT